MNHPTRALCMLLLVCGIASPAAAQWEQGGITWMAGPNGSSVNDCPGNCGAGCSDHYNPCGGPNQYWDMQFLAGPNYTFTGVYQSCVPTGGEGYHEIYETTKDWYEAIGRWSYHGWYRTACANHDAICSWETFPMCAAWAGCGSDGGQNQTWSYDEYITGYIITRYESVGTYPGPC